MKELKEEGEDSIEEAEEVKEEIEWRNANIEEAARDLFEELFGEIEEEEEEEEWDEDTPIYEPPSGDKNEDGQELSKLLPNFNKHILPVLDNYCLNCHDSESAKGDIDLEAALKGDPLFVILHCGKMLLRELGVVICLLRVKTSPKIKRL